MKVDEHFLNEPARQNYLTKNQELKYHYWVNQQTLTKGLVKIRIGEPMYGTNAKELTNDVYKWIEKNFDEIN